MRMLLAGLLAATAAAFPQAQTPPSATPSSGDPLQNVVVSALQSPPGGRKAVWVVQARTATGFSLSDGESKTLGLKLKKRQ